MKIPVQTTFRDVRPSARLERLIRKQVAKLVRHRPDLIGCRVAVDGPPRNRRSGGQYDVRIEVSVPGRDIVITHDQPSARHERCDAALRDAFKLARRALIESGPGRTRNQRVTVRRPVAVA